MGATTNGVSIIIIEIPKPLIHYCDNEDQAHYVCDADQDHEDILAFLEAQGTPGDEENVELTLVENFRCLRKMGAKKEPCSRRFDVEFIINRRLDMLSMTPREQDLALLGIISAGIVNSTDTECTNRKEQKEQKRAEKQSAPEDSLRSGRKECLPPDFSIPARKDRLDALIRQYKEEGLVPREKRSGGRRTANKRLLTFNDVKGVSQFMKNHTKTHALALPGRIPGFKRTDIMLLPTAHTRVFVYIVYQSVAEKDGMRIVCESSFRNIWKQLLPHIRTCRPMTDLCFKCQKIMGLIFRSSNLDEAEKGARLKQQEDHLTKVPLPEADRGVEGCVPSRRDH
ncbi:hypothetical protein CAPTEDRAFT_212414 [Capitella teleta]|uniref:Uncharacterized protein n=1 Tax=Capitella teleta TaxID=283909 RepID=R7TX76_CAPTE|nr:hypothetical protein CAPTEDRAFT_212414 [Capitella teleta]|eukprot:ELT98207.1 hypothetical protein CAPTEDRAFT_212414 [Capitella teleta]